MYDDVIYENQKERIKFNDDLLNPFFLTRWFYSLSMILLSFGSRRLITFVTSALPIIK